MSVDQPPGAWQIIEWLGTALVVVVQAVFGYQIVRIGKLEEAVANKADESDVTRVLREIRDEMQADRLEAGRSRDALHEKVNRVALGVARLEGAKKAT